MILPGMKYVGADVPSPGGAKLRYFGMGKIRRAVLDRADEDICPYVVRRDTFST